MSDPKRLEELFGQWKRTGTAPAELCRDDPQMLEHLQARILSGETTRDERHGPPLTFSIVIWTVSNSNNEYYQTHRLPPKGTVYAWKTP